MQAAKYAVPEMEKAGGGSIMGREAVSASTVSHYRGGEVPYDEQKRALENAKARQMRQKKGLKKIL